MVFKQEFRKTYNISMRRQAMWNQTEFLSCITSDMNHRCSINLTNIKIPFCSFSALLLSADNSSLPPTRCRNQEVMAERNSLLTSCLGPEEHDHFIDPDVGHSLARYEKNRNQSTQDRLRGGNDNFQRR